MTIGVVTREEMFIGTGDNKKTHKYLQLSIRPPFMTSATFTITTNKKKQGENEPDFIIYYSFNRKGEKFRRARVGAIWNKIKEDLEYKAGVIESPLFPNGKLNFSLFKAKPLEGEDPNSLTWIYDAIWSPYNPNANNQSQTDGEYSQAQSSNTSNNIPEYDIDEDEIPF